MNPDINNYKKELELLKEDQGNVDFFINIIKNNLRHNNSEYTKFISDILDYARENNLKRVEAYMLYYSLWQLYDTGKYDECLEICKKIRNTFEKNNDIGGLMCAYNALSTTYNKLGFYELALEFSMKSIKEAKKISNEETLYKLYINFITFNMQCNKYNEAELAMQYIDKKFKQISVNNNTKLIKICLIAQLELHKNNVNDAYKYINEAIQLYRSGQDSVFECKAYRILAICNYKMNNNKDAEKNFQLSMDIATKKDYNHEYCETLYEYCIYKFATNEDDIALKISQELISVLKENNYNIIYQEITEYLYKYYKKLNDYKNASDYLMQSISIKEAQEEAYENSKNKLNNNLDFSKLLFNLLQNNSEILYAIGQKVISALDIDEMLNILNNNANKIAHFDYLFLSFYSKNNRLITKCIYKNELFEITKNVNLIKDTFLNHCLSENKILQINSFDIECKENNYRPDFSFLQSKSGIYIPLTFKNSVIGLLSIQSKNENAFDVNDTNSFKIIGDYVAIAINNANLYKDVKSQAIHDGLTGCLSRKEIENACIEQIRNYKENGVLFSLAMIDIDDFKHINDTFGHVIGDRVIQFITRTIKNNIRKTDIIGRYGGDEFIILFINSHEGEIRKRVDKIIYKIANTILLTDCNEKVRASISIGVCEYSNKIKDYIELIDKADKELYINKSKNKLLKKIN